MIHKTLMSHFYRALDEDPFIRLHSPGQARSPVFNTHKDPSFLEMVTESLHQRLNSMEICVDLSMNIFGNVENFDREDKPCSLFLNEMGMCRSLSLPANDY